MEQRGSSPVQTLVWIRSPDCGNKTRNKVRTDTILINFPLKKARMNGQKMNKALFKTAGQTICPKRALPLPIPDVTVNTRKGVFVSYAPSVIAG